MRERESERERERERRGEKREKEKREKRERERDLSAIPNKPHHAACWLGLGFRSTGNGLTDTKLCKCEYQIEYIVCKLANFHVNCLGMRRAVLVCVCERE